MVQDLLKFIVVYVLMLVMFTHTFLRLVTEGANKTGKCSKDFATVPEASYR